MPQENNSLTDKKSVLFVCSANQCRSPMAMALFQDMIEKKGLDIEEWQIDSAGCWATYGLPATTSAISTMQSVGLNLEDHRSKPVTEILLDDYRLILCMEYGHKRNLRRNFPANAHKIFLLSEMIKSEHEIDDPVGLSIGIYQNTAVEIQKYLVNGFDKILRLTA